MAKQRRWSRRGVIAVAVLIGATLTLLILRLHPGPFAHVGGRGARAISAGDATVTLPPPSRDDIGEMTRALHLFREQVLPNARRLEREAEHQASHHPTGDRTGLNEGLRYFIWTGRQVAAVQFEIS